MNFQLQKLKGRLQHYQWGGFAFLPELLRLPVPSSKPCAEYWLGAHDNAPAVLAETDMSLNELIRQDPTVLGEDVRSAFGRLPYLLKVLDVRDMLSIQVHPTKKAAEAAFELENKQNIPLDAPHRNYKDNNHKPELMVALSDFWLLHGFRSIEGIIETIRAIPEFAFMFPLLEEGGYESLYRVIMQEDQDRVNRILDPLLSRIIPRYRENRLDKSSPDFWAARAALTFNEVELIDRGIFSIYLLNLVHLRPGEAVFQDAGVLHAYLEGQNVEIMANSDNVLRGGLTPKHIDVNELMKHVSFHEVKPAIITGTLKSAAEAVYQSPAPDFELSRIDISPGSPFDVHSHTVEIFLVMEGSVSIAGGKNPVNLERGEAAVTFAGMRCTVTAESPAVVFRATVPRQPASR